VTDEAEWIDISGWRRSYAVHVPANRPAGSPALLIVLHGRRLSSPEMRRISQFDAVADRHGFVAVYPDGHRASWNDGCGGTPAARDGVDDVRFIGCLIDRLVDRVGVDPSRIAVAGLSNGGSMCHRLALELSDRITAMASVAGPMCAAMAATTPSHAVSVLIIHGTADAYARIDGGPPHGVLPRVIRLLLGRRTVLSVSDTAARWQAINGCTRETLREELPPTAGDPTSVECVGTVDDSGNTATECWIVHGGGHTWPGGPRLLPLGRTSSHFDASEAIWQFVDAHSRPAAERRFATV
jgi:polyhydroxybutyrate depolymerase